MRDRPDIVDMYTGRYWAHMGIEVLEVTAGSCTSRIQLKEHHFNSNQVVHGGVISGLIDSAAGIAVRSARTPEAIAAAPNATSDLHVQYLSAARGSELLATARVLKAGRTAVFADVDVRDDQGRIVARGSGTFVISPAHRRAGA